MAVKVNVANLALSKIGENDQLVALDSGKASGRAILAVWDMVRQATLRSGNWNFAIRRTGLAEESLPSVPYPWSASFRLPADNLRLIEVLSLTARADYQIEGGAVLANQAGPLYIRYVRDVPEPAEWDALFAEAFACRLAYQIADRITGDKQRQAAQWDAFRAALAEAKRCDAIENPAIVQDPTDWESARWGGNAYGGTVPNTGSYLS